MAFAQSRAVGCKSRSKPFNPLRKCLLDIHRIKTKSQRSAHIHICRRNELIYTLKRPKCELKYCSFCFRWLILEEWEKHCQVHLDSINSKCCGTITYCHTLLRPALCPFCLGDKRPEVSATKRWSSWTREAQLRDHLQQHLLEACWPLKCPHPLCNLELDNQLSFVYHLTDVHSLMVNGTQQSKLISGSHDGTPEVKSRKRRAQDAAERELRPSKQAKGRQENYEQSTCQLLEEAPPTTTPTLTPNTSPDVFLPSHTEVADPPELIHTRATSTPDSYEPILMDNDALFSQYLRSRSPSCSSLTDKDDRHSNVNHEGGIHLHTVAPRETELPVEMNPLLARSVIDQAIHSNECPFEVPKRGVRLRLRQPKPQPKITLRLSRPKKSVARISARRTHNHQIVS